MVFWNNGNGWPWIGKPRGIQAKLDINQWKITNSCVIWYISEHILKCVEAAFSDQHTPTRRFCLLWRERNRVQPIHSLLVILFICSTCLWITAFHHSCLSLRYKLFPWFPTYISGGYVIFWLHTKCINSRNFINTNASLLFPRSSLYCRYLPLSCLKECTKYVSELFLARKYVDGLGLRKFLPFTASSTCSECFTTFSIYTGFEKGRRERTEEKDD